MMQSHLHFWGGGQNSFIFGYDFCVGGNQKSSIFRIRSLWTVPKGASINYVSIGRGQNLQFFADGF